MSEAEKQPKTLKRDGAGTVRYTALCHFRASVQICHQPNNQNIIKDGTRLKYSLKFFCLSLFSFLDRTFTRNRFFFLYVFITLFYSIGEHYQRNNNA